MEWSDGSDDVSAGGKERNQMDEQVLQSLQPHSNLEKLRIESYDGLVFPRWVSDASLLSKMVELSLVNCKKCTSLPCLGQLPSLKRLLIGRMDGVKEVGEEFYGKNNIGISNSADKFFPSLVTLHFVDMSEWEHWGDWPSTMESLIFPRLHELRIQDCPKLIKNLPTYLPDLTKLIVYNCPKLEFPPALRLPSLKELDIYDCNGRVLRSGTALTSQLTELNIGKISGPVKLDEGFVQNLGGVQALENSGCKELTCLWDDDDDDGFGSESQRLPCDNENLRHDHDHQLVSLGLGLGCNLRSLKIYNCGKLKRLPNGWHKSLTCLEELDVDYCLKLVSFPDVGFPPNLRRLTLSRCEGLKRLPDGMMMLKTTKTSNGSSSSNNNNLCVLLETLEIDYCSSLICFPKGQLPVTLKTLRVDMCRRLSSLPEGMMMIMQLGCNSNSITTICALEYLIIERCPSLTDFPEGSLPTTIKQLKISNCENLKSLPEGIMYQPSSKVGTNGALEVLYISDCPALTSFPRGQFPSTLEELHILECEKMESISEKMFRSTSNSLQYLRIESYPRLETLADCLPDLSYISITDCENLELRPHQFQNFTRLILLKISRCKNIKTPLSQWGLSRLTSLGFFSIVGIFPDATSFSDHDHHVHSGILPSTLTSLSVREFQSLESLTSLSLQNLSSLETLKISGCPKLRSIFPSKKRLPPTLSRLSIVRCPLLYRRYSGEEGKDWPNIAHIPRVDL